MRDDPSVTLLLTRAQAGDQQAWNALVERYAPLVWSICRRRELGGADAADVGQNVWLRLVGQLDHIRVLVLDAENIPGQQTALAEQQLLTAERHAALQEALTRLPTSCQQLIAMLIDDPPVRYTRISAQLGIPIGSIGPTRRRCLNKLRCHPAITALVTAEPSQRRKLDCPGKTVPL